MSRGIIYAAVGEQFVKEVLMSAKSVKRVMPDIPITFYTDHYIESEHIDQVELLPLKYQNHLGIKLYKPQAIAHMPYMFNIFLDSDTYLCDSIYEVFDVLKHVECAAVPDTADMSQPIVGGENVRAAHPYNSGMLALKKSDSVLKFVEDWIKTLEDEYDGHPWDQRAMMTSLIHNKIHTIVLNPIYNCRTNFMVSLPQLKVKIIHGRDINFEEVERRLNSVVKNRVWAPKRQNLLLKKRTSFLKKVLMKLGLVK